MPAKNKTKHLELNAWQGNEYVKREDFVSDNVKIDALADFAHFASINNVEHSERDLGGGFSEYTAIIKDKSTQEEIGRKVTTESMNGKFEVYTMVITLHGEVTTITTVETETGWNQVVS